MSVSPRAPRSGVPGSTVRFVLLSILTLCLVLPPETRGESAAGCSLLILLLALLTTAHVASGPASALALGLALAWPLTLLSLAPGLAVEPLATLLLAATLGVCTASRARDVRTSLSLPTVLVAVAVLVSLHAFYQVAFGLEALARSVEASPGLADRDAILARLRAGRAFGAFATPAACGGLLAITLPVTVAFAWGHTRGKRLLLLAAATAQGAALAATASAGAVSALLVAIVVLLVRRAASARALALAALALSGVLAGIVAWRGASVIDPTHAESPWRLRAGNVRAAAAMAIDHPWTGVGPGAYGDAYPLYREAGDNESRHAHDLPAEWLAEYGIPVGLMLSAAFFWLFLGPILGRPRPGPIWLGGVRVGLAAFALHNLVDFTAVFPSFLLAAAVLRGACAREGDPEPAGVRLWPARFAPVAVAALAGAIVALSGLAWNARVAVRTGPGSEIEPGRTTALAGRSVALAPWDPDARMLRAETLLRSADPAAALADADAAVRRTPLRASARALRGRIRAALGDVPGAFADFEEATRLYPMRREYAKDRDALAAKLPDSSRAGSEP